MTPIERMAALLSRHVTAWWVMVNLDALDMASPDGDGLLEQIDAQLHPSLPPLALLLGIPGEPLARMAWEVEHGLRPLLDDMPEMWDALSDAWRAHITAQRARTAGQWVDETLARRARAPSRDRQHEPRPMARVCRYNDALEVVRTEPLPVEVAATMVATNNGLGDPHWVEAVDIEREVDFERASVGGGV